MNIEKINTKFRRFGQFVVNHRIIVMIAFAALLAFSVAGLKRIYFETSFDTYFVKDDPMILKTNEFKSIFGNDYPTPDGTCLRDYIDIVDRAKAHVCAVSRMLDGRMKEPYEIFNVGTGRPVSVLELVTAFEKVNGLKLNYRFAPRRPGDVTAIWADPTLANEELGWKAERRVEETLAAAWAWAKKLATDSR